MSTNFDLVCFSHLRWDFVYQRPQHLLSRCARWHRVFFIEEPVPTVGPPELGVESPVRGVYVVRPHLPEGLSAEHAIQVQQAMLASLFDERGIHEYVLWYYTPMAVTLTGRMSPLATVYDCMDELSLFAGAPPALRHCEQRLFRLADLVFTGGQSLFAAKRAQHPNVYPFPSSVDSAHFGRARAWIADPADQAALPHPRLGFYGVIDERMDFGLLDRLARARPQWQLVMIGPVVKIDPARLPRRPNIHYLGSKPYAELPTYLAHWSVAMMPFARNEATRFISPTKTLEYLAAGKPVISTPIADVVEPYGRLGLAEIAEDAAGFVAAAERLLAGSTVARHKAADAFLTTTSWDLTWDRMHDLLQTVIAARRRSLLRFKSETVKGEIPMAAAVKGATGVLAFPKGPRQPADGLFRGEAE